MIVGTRMEETRASVSQSIQSLYNSISYSINIKATRARVLVTTLAVVAVFGLLHFNLASNALILVKNTPILHTSTHKVDDDAVKERPTGPHIPKKIWQIFLRPANSNAPASIDPSRLEDSVSWLAANPDYQYRLVGDKGAIAVLDKFDNYGIELRAMFNDLPNTGMKSDFLRYLILLDEGGIYADTDVEAIRPVDTWIPAEYVDKAKVIVGIEFDRLEGNNWGEVHDDLQFCQWTVAAAPNHPLLHRMVKSVIFELEEVVSAVNSTLDSVAFSNWDVISVTGPSKWTDVVFEQLQINEPSLTSLRNLTGLAAPLLVGDILVLPINGFGMGQLHSGSQSNGSIPADALVRHNFRGTWRHERRRG